MSRTSYIELSTQNVRSLDQLGTPISIWNCSAVPLAYYGREFRSTVERHRNGCDSVAALFMCPNQCINQRILQASSLTEMSIFLLLNLVRLELRSERLNQFGRSK